MSFSTIKPKIGNKDYPRLDEVVDTFSFPPDEWVTLRFLPSDIISIKQHWISIVTKTGKAINLPRYCLAHSPTGGEDARKDEDGKPIPCIYCTLRHGNDKSGAPANANTAYYANAIVREIQEDEPRRTAPHTKGESASGFKDMKSKSWTPIRVIRLTPTMIGRIQELGENNRVKNKKKGTTEAYDITDVKYGIDVRIKYKPKAAGSDKYSIDAESRSPITEDEEKLLSYKLDMELVELTGLRSVKEAESDFRDLDIAGGDIPDEDDEDDSDSYSLGSKKKKKAAFDDDDEDGDDEAPVKKKKKKAAFDDDEEDEPARKKKKKRPAFDDDDEEDEAPVKKKKKRPAFDDDDEEDEAPVKKKKKRPAFDDEDEAPVKKKKKKVVEDDEPVRKKKKKKVVEDDEPVRKKKKKKRPTFDDDDE